MFKILFVWLFLFCFSAFGEKAPETSKVVSTKEVNKAVSKGTVPAKAEVKASASSTELDQSSNISPSPASQEDSSVKSGESSTGSLTYHEALDRYREAAHLEWVGGIGMDFEIDSLTFFVPVVLEFHIPIIQIDEKLTGLLQGGMLWIVQATRRPSYDYLGRRVRPDPGGRDVTTVFQAGLKYSFSNQSYGSFKVGPLGLFVRPFPPNVWTGGLFFGFGSDSLTMEVGLQSFYEMDRGLWGFGFVVNMGSVLKKWWSARH